MQEEYKVSRHTVRKPFRTIERRVLKK
ncbi:hypothetical protein PO124_13445 [Bacillus licheniformis]|nr:hypothetical protein [Bacillus licheniformis]